MLASQHETPSISSHFLGISSAFRAQSWHPSLFLSFITLCSFWSEKRPLRHIMKTHEEFLASYNSHEIFISHSRHIFNPWSGSIFLDECRCVLQTENVYLPKLSKTQDCLFSLQTNCVARLVEVGKPDRWGWDEAEYDARSRQKEPKLLLRKQQLQLCSHTGNSICDDFTCSFFFFLSKQSHKKQKSGSWRCSWLLDLCMFQLQILELEVLEENNYLRCYFFSGQACKRPRC